MSVSVFGNLDLRRISIARTVSGPEVAAGWCKDALHPFPDGRIMSRSYLLFCLSNRRIGHSSAYSGMLAPRQLPRSYRPPASSSSGWTKIAMKTHRSEFSIFWACECDLLAQEVILAHSATPGCCFDNFMSMAPNNVQYISDMSACKQHTDPERVRSLLRQSDDTLVEAWCVTHGNECRLVHSDTHTAGNTCTDHSSFGKRCGMAGPRTKIFYIWSAVMRQVRPKVLIAENVTQFGLQPHERELGDVYACVRIVVSAVEQGWATTRVRQFVFMFHKPWIYPLLAAAGLPASVPSPENQLALQSVLRLFERQCGYTGSAYLVTNETELAEELAWAMNRPDVMKRICMP